MPDSFKEIGASVSDTLENQIGYHQTWITFAQTGIDEFADLRENEALANCLIILGKYATIYPTLVARAMEKTTYLSTLGARGMVVFCFFQFIDLHKFGQMLWGNS